MHLLNFTGDCFARICSRLFELHVLNLFTNNVSHLHAINKCGWNWWLHATVWNRFFSGFKSCVHGWLVEHKSVKEIGDFREKTVFFVILLTMLIVKIQSYSKGEIISMETSKNWLFIKIIIMYFHEQHSIHFSASKIAACTHLKPCCGV